MLAKLYNVKFVHQPQSVMFVPDDGLRKVLIG